jgi:hypothetical protein
MVPEEYMGYFNIYMKDFMEKFPTPNEDAFHKFSEDGLLWRIMDDYPTWLSENDVSLSLQRRILYCDSVFAIDPETGRPKWIYEGTKIPNISPTIGENILYITEVEVSEEGRKKALAERDALIQKGVYEVGDEKDLKPEEFDVRKVVALDYDTGDVVWEKHIDLTGCGGYRLGSAYHKDGILVFMGHFSNHDRNHFNDGQLTWRRLTAVDVKNGEVIWSRPLNYLRRPLVMGDRVIIEPRACDVKTGEIIMRTHPVTGEEVPWEFYRPGHSCSVTSGSENCLFFRSYNNAFYDISDDRGLSYFGGIRTGCWVNYIPANGLLMVPESSSGCTCSFPLRCTVVMKHQEKKRPKDWTVYIAHGSLTPAKRFGVNFGAPGDMKDDDGNVWFGYPRPNSKDQKGNIYGVRFALNEEINGPGYYSRDFRGITINGSDKPWLLTNGCVGLSKFELPLIDDTWGEEPATYTVRLGFTALKNDCVGQRVFDIKVNGNIVAENVDILREAGSHDTLLIKEFDTIQVTNNMVVELVPKVLNPAVGQLPVIQYVEAIQSSQSDDIVIQPKAGTANVSELETILSKADAAFEENNKEEALALYHQAFDNTKSQEIMLKAMSGMAKIGDESSLCRAARFRELNAPILWEFSELGQDLIAASYQVYMAIAKNKAEQDKQAAVRMLENVNNLQGFDELKTASKQLLSELNGADTE